MTDGQPKPTRYVEIGDISCLSYTRDGVNFHHLNTLRDNIVLTLHGYALPLRPLGPLQPLMSVTPAPAEGNSHIPLVSGIPITDPRITLSKVWRVELVGTESNRDIPPIPFAHKATNDFGNYNIRNEGTGRRKIGPRTPPPLEEENIVDSSSSRKRLGEHLKEVIPQKKKGPRTPEEVNPKASMGRRKKGPVTPPSPGLPICNPSSTATILLKLFLKTLS